MHLYSETATAIFVFSSKYSERAGRSI